MAVLIFGLDNLEQHVFTFGAERKYGPRYVLTRNMKGKIQSDNILLMSQRLYLDFDQFSRPSDWLSSASS